MKKIWLALAASLLLVGSLFTSCMTSQSQTLASNEVSDKAVVLGPVSVESKTYSYTNILKAARQKYPDTQDVVHIQTDILRNGKYLMYGIAVRY